MVTNSNPVIRYIPPPVSLEEDLKKESKKFTLNFDKAFNMLSKNIHENFKIQYESKNKSGRFYGKHRASAPNETPAKITGNLLQQTRFEILNQLFNGENKKNLSIIDGTNKGYSYYLEFGTKSVKPRKGFEKAITKAEPTFYKDLINYE